MFTRLFTKYGQHGICIIRYLPVSYSLLLLRTAAGDLKYKTLGKAVMASLALSHGNADAERGFSTNKKVVTADRSRLCEGTINAVRLLKDAMRCHGGLSTTMSVTPALVRRVQGAYSRYKEHLEEEQGNYEKNNY